MKEAYDKDRLANKQGRPALQKLILLDHVTKELRKAPIQEKLLDKGGIKWLGYWLEKLPDGSYPNQRLASEVLSTLNII